jgi:YVTN family beta-propeller protein
MKWNPLAPGLGAGLGRKAAVALLGALGASQVTVAAGSREIAAHCVYVTNEMSGDLTVIDGSRLQTVATLPLGKRPRGLQFSPDGNLLYVALSGSPIAPPGVDESTLPPADKGADGIGVVDTRTLRLVRVLRGVSDPEQVTLDSSGERLFVASEDTGTAVVQRASDGEQLASLKVGGEPEGVATSPDGRYVYMSSEEDHSVSVIDTRTLEVSTRFEVGQRPRAIVFAADGSRAYVTGELDSSLTVVDARSHRPIERLTLKGENIRPMGVAVAPDGGTVYVATGRGGSVLELDASPLQQKRALRVGERPWTIALTPDGKRLYTANGPSNDVSVVDVGSWSVVATLPVGQRPWGVTVGSACAAPGKSGE